MCAFLPYRYQTGRAAQGRKPLLPERRGCSGQRAYKSDATFLAPMLNTAVGQKVESVGTKAGQLPRDR